FSNIACCSLLYNKNYLSKVEKYLNWYINHLNFTDTYGAHGTIYDYFLKTNGSLVSTFDYDSYDSYPATFLSLLKDYYTVSKNTSFFISNSDYIHAITASMLNSADADGLTWAKPNYKVKYLMDNCEVYKGITDAIFIYKEIFKNSHYLNMLKIAKNKIYGSIEANMWNDRDNFYYYQIDANNNKGTPHFTHWYPDATSQLFPILSGLIDPTSKRALYIYDRFNKAFPEWNVSKPNGSFPDVYIGYVGLLMKDYYKVHVFLDFCRKSYIDKGNIWPWYSVESAYYIKILQKI
ncbi:MAG: hypothetical protein Q8880_12985, partial [Bacteroidota bacterium]|nr:hypothetical protein [Bacteroidota bacterium]